MKKIVPAALIGLLLSGCAKGAAQIIPAAVPVAEYQHMNCPALFASRSKNLEIVNALAISQEQARSNDTVGVLLTGLPLASMSGGDRAAELAIAKGRDLSIVSIIAAKQCS